MVLIADDNPTILNVLQSPLVAQAYQVVMAQARAQRPALVLVDIQMPHVLGLTLIRQMRADAALAGTPTIALMARALSGDRERCLRVGARGYLCKPVKFDELLGRCNRPLATVTAARGNTGR